MEREAVIGMHDPRDRSPACRYPAERPRFGGVRVRHVEPAAAKQRVQGSQRPQIVARVDRRAQGRLHDHLQARRGRLIKQAVPTAGDDRDLEGTGIKRLRAAQREHARPALQPGDEDGHPQRPDAHQAARTAAAVEFSHDR